MAKTVEQLMAERKRVAIKLSQSALDVAYKGDKLNMNLVNRLARIERELDKVRKTFRQM